MCHFRKVEVQKEFEDFTDESRQLEQELETTLLQNEKQINDLNYTITKLSEETESLRVSVRRSLKLITIDDDSSAYLLYFSKE